MCPLHWSPFEVVPHPSKVMRSLKGPSWSPMVGLIKSLLVMTYPVNPLQRLHPEAVPRPLVVMEVLEGGYGGPEVFSWPP